VSPMGSIQAAEMGRQPVGQEGAAYLHGKGLPAKMSQAEFARILPGLYAASQRRTGGSAAGLPTFSSVGQAMQDVEEQYSIKKMPLEMMLLNPKLSEDKRMSIEEGLLRIETEKSQAMTNRLREQQRLFKQTRSGKFPAARPAPKTVPKAKQVPEKDRGGFFMQAFQKHLLGGR